MFSINQFLVVNRKHDKKHDFQQMFPYSEVYNQTLNHIYASIHNYPLSSHVDYTEQANTAYNLNASCDLACTGNRVHLQFSSTHFRPVTTGDRRIAFSAAATAGFS
jgi:hypothetical protein